MCFIPTSTVMIRREVLSKVGVFNPKYRRAQDYDLWLRIAEHYPIEFINQPLASYRVNDEKRSRNIELMIKADFQIMEYWLTKKPELRRELKSQIKQKRTRLHYELALHHYHNNNRKKALMEFIKWGFYKIIPFDLIPAYRWHLL
jgi:GT2 family glycosyltransferase